MRPVRLIIPFPYGAAMDIHARLIGRWLSERLGQQFIIESRPGAAGNIGAEQVARALADGYTLLMVEGSVAINVTLYNKLNFNFLRDIVPVASIDRLPLVMEVHPSVPAKTVPEFIAYAKANPGKINMASSGTGTTAHVAGELFNIMSGIGMVHVPYRGAQPATTDLLGGQVQVFFPSVTNVIEYVKAGQVRALALTTAMRSEALPGVPAVSEYLPGYEASTWYGIGAPRNTPTEIVSMLNTAVNAALADPNIRARLADLGGEPLSLTQNDFAKLITDEIEKWAKVIRAANIKVE
jgi:tripartite-type tricarboxylate transporter receptor subunit TctC